METPKLPLMPESVPDVNWLMKMVNYLFSRDFDAQAFNSFIDFSKGLNDAKRRLFFGLMGLVVYLKRRVAELGGTVPDIRPFTKYNWIIAEFGQDPVGNAKRELEGLPEGAGKDLEGADYNQIARVVRGTLGLNRPLDEGLLSQIEEPSVVPIEERAPDLNPKYLLRIYLPDREVREDYIVRLQNCHSFDLCARLIITDMVNKEHIASDLAHDIHFLEAIVPHLISCKGKNPKTLQESVSLWVK